MPVEKTDSGILPMENGVKNLLDMFEFYLTERQLGRPIDKLGESVRDLRILIGRILIDYFLRLDAKDEEKFCSALAAMLAERAERVPTEDRADGEHVNYCITEIITSFEYAHEIKENFPDDPVFQKMLALDIPILRPFDYGLKGKLKIIPPQKKKIRRH